MAHNILVIDHDPLVRNRVASLLEARGMTADQAATEHEAFSLLASNDYSIVMLDLMLPDENGFRVLDHVRTYFPKQAQHMVVMTNADPKFVSNLPRDGWCAILVKPFPTAEFHRIIELCLAGPHEVDVAQQQ